MFLANRFIFKMSELTSSCVKRCCVNGCKKSTRSHPYHSFFRFPVEEARYVKWLKAIGRLDILEKGFKLSSYRICESHFARSSISTFVNSEVNSKNKKVLCYNRLTKNAIPTLNINLSVDTGGGPSGMANNCNSYFMVTPKRVELVTCDPEIVSIPPDPLFKYNDLSISATNTVNCIEYNESTLPEKGIDKSSPNFKDIPNIKKKKNDKITDSDLRNKHSVDCVYIPNLRKKKIKKVTNNDLREKLRRLLTVSLQENDKSAENSEDCVYITDIKKDKNEDYIDSQFSSTKAGIITNNSGEQPTDAVSSIKTEDCAGGVQINSQEDEKLHEDSEDEDCVFVSSFKQDHTNSQPSSSQTNVAALIPFAIKHDPPLKTPETYVNLIMKMTEDKRLKNKNVRTEEYDDYYSTNNASKQLVNIRPVLNNMLEVSPDIFKRNENVVKTNSDENALSEGNTDTICVKSENIEDLHDISDTQLMEGNTNTICVKSENIEDLLDISDTQLN